MKSLPVCEQSLVSRFAIASALAANTLKTRGFDSACSATYRRIGKCFRCAFGLLVVLGIVGAAQAQSPQLYNWTTALGGSSVFGPVSIALDTSGNLYVVNNIGNTVIPGLTGAVIRIPPSDPTCSTPGDCINVAPSYNSTYSYYGPNDQNATNPIHVAVDSAGNVFIQIQHIQSDENFFVRVPSTDLTCSTPGDCIETGLTQSCSEIAVDGSGNVYDCYSTPGTGPSAVMEYTLSGNTYTATGTNIPETVAQELGGNPGAPLFAADAGGNLYTIVGQSLTKYTAVGGGAFIATTISTNFPGPLYAAAVDWSGNIYVSGDGGLWKFVPASGGAYTQSLQGSTVNALIGDGSGDLFIGYPYGGDFLFEIHTGPVNFGSVPVGTTSAAIQLDFQWSTPPGGPSPVLTQGAAGQDYAQATNPGALVLYPAYPSGYPDGSCGNYYQFSPCYVYVQFAPTKPGERQGAAGVLNNSGATVGTTLIQGIGVAPQAVIYPGTQSAPYTAASSGLAAPGGLALDGFGDVYIADTTNNQVVAQLSNGQIVVANAVSNGLASPAGIASDGNGDIYIADTGNSRIVEEVLSNPGGTAIQVGGGYSYTQAALTTSPLSAPEGVAVDGAGNVYIADTGNNRVLMEKLSGGSYTESTLGSDLASPAGVAVDGSGNVFIADTGNGRVLKESLSGGVYTQSVVVGELSAPHGIALDGVGNIYIADTGNNRVLLEAFSGGSYTEIPVAVGLNSPQAVTVTGSGNVYIADTNNQRVVLVDVSDPPFLTFPVTPVGSSSSPQTLTLVNIGNAPLEFPVPGSGENPAIGADFTLNSSDASACPVVSSGAPETGALAAGASCELSITYTPATTIGENESLALTDNHLNGTNVTQTIALHGDGLAALTITWPAQASISYGTPLGSTQLDATANIPGTFAYTPALGTVLNAGSQTLSVTFTPNDTGDYSTTTATATLQVSQVAPAITWAAPAAVPSGTALSATQLDATANVPGTFIYTPAAGTVLPFGWQTLSVTFTPTDTTDYTAATDSVSLAVGPTAAQPAFSVAGGTYTAPQLVAISDATAGATVYYTTDGSTPTIGSFQYSGPIPIAASETINAVASGAGYNLSPVASATYTLNNISPIITTVAGNGSAGYSGDGGSATSAQFNYPVDAVPDGSGSFYISDLYNHVVRKVTADGLAATIAGNGTQGYTGDGGPAAGAQLSEPAGLALDSGGNLYIADVGNNTVRKVTPSGSISTVAGNGTAGYSGDSGAASGAELNYPRNLAFDANGNLYIADFYNNRVRMVTPAGIITTVAGNGAGGYSGDGGLAVGATLTNPSGVAVDPAGNLYITDDNNERIRKVAASGIIMTVAGSGCQGFSGDGGQATSACLFYPSTITVDPSGILYITDYYNNRIRKVDQFGIITTVAGSGSSGGPSNSFGGDGGPATSAELNGPGGVSLDAYGNIYIADTGNNRIRKVGVAATPQTITFGPLPNVTYGLAPFALSATASSGLPVTFSISSGPASISNGVLSITGAGTVVVAANQAGNSSYGAAGTVTQNFTVARAPLKVKVKSASMKYGSALPAFSSSITGLVDGDVLTETFSTTATSSSSVGVYSVGVVLSGSALENYSPIVVPGKLTVNPAKLTVAAVGVSAVYGAALPALSYDITGLVNGDSAGNAVTGAPLLSTAAVQGSPAGTYTISVALGSLTASNYSFTAKSGILRIAAAPLTVAASPATSVYQAALPTFSYTVSGFVNNDSASILAGAPTETTTAVQGSSAGNYTIKIVAATLSAGSNYTLSFVNGTLTITKAVLTVTPNSASKIYGKANPALTVSYSGFLGTDTSSVVHGSPALTTTAVADSGVGSYPITAMVGTLSATNYTFNVSGSGTLTVTPAKLTVTAANKSATYGAALPTFTDSITGFVNGDSAATAVSGTASLTSGATQGSPVGTYTITAAIGSLSAANYTFAFTNGTLTINPAKLTVTPVNVSVIYGVALPSFTYNITGFVNGDSAGTAVTGTPLLSTTAGQGSPAGTYTISDALNTLTAANYTFVLKNGTLTIAPS